MPTTGNRFSDELLRVHTLADLICWAMERQVYVSLMKAGPDDRSFVGLGGWAGGQPTEPSRAPFVATSKAAELLLLYYGDHGGLMLTPIPNFQFSTGWMGGARFAQNIVGVSKWEQQHDLLLALILLYSFEYETRLHHIGWRMESEEAMREASSREFKAGFDGVELPTTDHLRIYHWHPDDRNLNGGYHTEYQFFPNGKQTPAIHIDVSVASPDTFLRFVAKGLGVEPMIWDDDPEGPYGAVWAIGDDQSVMGVMARDHWNRLIPQPNLVDAQRPRILTGRP